MYNLSYAEVMDDLCSDQRLNEHEAMSIVIGKLNVAQERGVKSPEAVDALFYTRRLWSYFLEHLADERERHMRPCPSCPVKRGESSG